MQIALIHYAAPPVVGGVESVLGRQAELFQRAGHQVRIAAGRGAAWDARIPVILLPRLDSLHPEVLELKRSLDCGEIPPDFEQVVSATLADLQEALEGVQVVIAHNVASLNKNLALTAALHRLASLPGGPRLILWHHDLAWTTPRYQAELHPGWPWDLLRKAWPGARQVAVSEARRDELAALMGIPAREIAIIPAGVDLRDFFHVLPGAWSLYEALGMPSARPLLLSPVRMTPRKNLEQGLHILGALRQHLPSARLVVTGPPGAHNPHNDAYFRSLRELRASLGLQGAVHLLAEQRGEGLQSGEVADFYHLADALLLTSREEGFGIPILESGLARMPVFCADLPPLRSLAGDQAVYFSPDSPPEDVAAQIAERLAADTAYRLRERVLSGYTWQAIYDRLIAPLLEAA